MLSRLVVLSHQVLPLLVQVRLLLRLVAQVIQELLEAALLLGMTFARILFYLLLELEKVIAPLSMCEFKPRLRVLPRGLSRSELPFELFDLQIRLFLLGGHVLGLNASEILEPVLLVSAHLL